VFDPSEPTRTTGAAPAEHRARRAKSRETLRQAA
jgi:hypothetical protein